MVITHPITGTPVTLLSPSDVYGLAGKIAMEILSGAEISNQYPELEKTVEQWYEIHGYARATPAESVATDPDSTSRAAAKYPVFVAEYFKDFDEKRYYVDYRPQDVNKVLNGTMSFDSFMATIINTLAEGYRLETNDNIRNALGYIESTGSETDKAVIVLNADGTVDTTAKSVLGNLGQYESLETPTFAQIYSELLTHAKKMTRQNDDYSNGFVCGAMPEDIQIYLPIDFTAKAGFNFLSKWNNQGEANKLPTIHETDGLSFATTGGGRKGVALLLDKRFIAHVEKYRDTMEYEVPERGHAHGVSFLVNDAITLAKNWKGFAIVFDIPAGDDPVTVNVNGAAEIVG